MKAKGMGNSMFVGGGGVVWERWAAVGRNVNLADGKCLSRRVKLAGNV